MNFEPIMQQIFVDLKKNSTFAVPKRDDSLAQQVEHNTFNVGVLGSSPRRITGKAAEQAAFFVGYSWLLWVPGGELRRHLSTKKVSFVDAERKLQPPVHTEGARCGRNVSLCIFATV